MLTTIGNLTHPAELGRSPLLLLKEAEKDETASNDVIELYCRDNPLYWLRNHTLTENEQWKKEGLPFKAPFPFKPFPGQNYDYFDVLFEHFKTDDRIAIPKTRDMVTSWSAMGWGTNQAQWQKATVVVQSLNEDKSKKLVNYAKILYDNQPEWLRNRHPLEEINKLHLKYLDGGEVFGIPAGEHQIRMHHPTIVIFDEAAFLPEFQQCWDAAHPVAGQMIAVSSAGPGSFAVMCSR